MWGTGGKSPKMHIFAGRGSERLTMCNLWKSQRELQDFCIFTIKACTLGPTNTLSPNCLSSSCRNLSWLPSHFSHILFKPYFHCFLVHAVVSSLPCCFQILPALKNRHHRAYKMITGSISKLFFLLKNQLSWIFCYGCKKPQTPYALKAVILFIQSRANLLSKYGELFDISSKKFKEKNERQTNELMWVCVRLLKWALPWAKATEI